MRGKSIVVVVALLLSVLPAGGAAAQEAGSEPTFGAADRAGARREAAQVEAAARLERDLRSRSGGRVRVERHAETGVVRAVGTSAGRPIPAETGTAGDPVRSARAFLARHGAAFGLRDAAAELGEARVRPGQHGQAVRVQQQHRGVPVLGGELVVAQDDEGNVLSASGELLPDLDVDVQPVVPAADVPATARAVVAKARGVAGDGLEVETPQLWIFDPVLLGGEGVPGARLVWRTEVSGGLHELDEHGDPIDELVLVDARTGGVALHFEQHPHARNRRVCDFNNVRAASPACVSPVRVEGGAATGVNDVDMIYDVGGQTYDFFFSRWGRDGIDGNGGVIEGSARYCDLTSPCPFVNAFWDGTRIVFGTGLAVDDVVGHEFAHGVVEHEANLFYYYQSGAINESMADVFGEIIDLTNGSADDTAGNRWLLGEGSSIGVIRNMANPPAFGDPDRMQSTIYHSTGEDNGGVHINSGVSNKAATLMADGGTFNGVTVAAIGLDKTATVFYDALANLLTSASDFRDLGFALVQACENRRTAGSGGFTAANCTAVANAVTATEMHLEPVTGAALRRAEVCPTGQSPSLVSYDDFESGIPTRWVSGGSGGDAWAASRGFYGVTYARSGVESIAGPNNAVVSDRHMARTASVTLPANAFLHVSHAYDLERNWDGGVIEYSTNEGASWTDARPLFDRGDDYRATLGSGSALAGQQAFTGASGGWGSTRLNLASLAGQPFRIRFRLASDSSIATFAWFVDDVAIYTCGAATTAPGVPTGVTATPGNAQASVSWSPPASNGGSPITGYTVTASPGGQTASVGGATTTATVTGLTNGTSYTFTVRATNAVGTSAASSPSNQVTPIGPPGPPVAVNATPGNAQASVSWSPPASNGGSPITGYTVTASPGGQTASVGGSTTTATVTGLTNGTTYTFTVRATNAAGQGPASAASNAVTPGAPVTVPGAPTGVTATAGNAEAVISWSAPASDGGSAITGYIVTASPGGVTRDTGGGARLMAFTGLTNGVSYTFTVRAVNAAGQGPASAPSNAVTPRTVPSAPTGVSASAGNAQATVSWTPPASNGGAAITGYTVTVSPGGATRSAGSGATSLVVDGLTNGTTYTFTVTAANVAGNGPASAPSNAVTPSAGPTVPGAPTGVTATAGNAQATVTWTPPASNGGSAITGYTVTASPGGQTASTSGATSLTVPGLANGTTYTFTVRAANAIGQGPPSAASNAVTPSAPVTVPGAPRNLAGVAGDTVADISWQAPASNGGSPLTGYLIVVTVGGNVIEFDEEPGVTSAGFEGMTNGVQYRFVVHARNAVGLGPASNEIVLTPQPAGPPPANGPRAFDGVPTTTQRVTDGSAVGGAIAVSLRRFAATTETPTQVHRRAAHVVLSRDDTFPDSLAGAPLTATGPLLFTQTGALPQTTGQEILRVLPAGGTVYLLGGEAAISSGVANQIAALGGRGYRVVRLSGPSRIETSLRIADEVRRIYPGAQTRDVLVARAFGAPGNETSGWADSVTGGAYGAWARIPVVLTPTGSVHGALAQWIARDNPSSTILLGGTGALSDTVLRSLPRSRRVSGSERTATAAEVARQLFATPTTGARRFVIMNGFDRVGWAHGLAAAGIAADARAPMLMVSSGAVPGPTAALAGACGAAQVDLFMIGSTAAIPDALRVELDRLDGGSC